MGKSRAVLAVGLAVLVGSASAWSAVVRGVAAIEQQISAADVPTRLDGRLPAPGAGPDTPPAGRVD